MITKDFFQSQIPLIVHYSLGIWPMSLIFLPFDGREGKAIKMANLITPTVYFSGEILSTDNNIKMMKLRISLFPTQMMDI